MKRTYISLDSKRSCSLVEIDRVDTLNLLRLLDVASLGTNCKAHQLSGNCELLATQRSRMEPCALCNSQQRHCVL